MIESYAIEFRAMGCKVEFQLETEADGISILNRMPAKLERYEAILSRFRESSELSHLNRHSGQWVEVSEVLFEVVQQAKHGARRTDGLYNPLVLQQMIANGYYDSFESIDHPTTHDASPVANWEDIGLRLKTHEVFLPAGSAIDLGGIAKGWASAKIADELSQYGACLVNLGGDITMRGAPSGLPGWEIELNDPITGEPLTTLFLKDTTIITSGVDYRRWVSADGDQRHHIIDPRTGQSAETDVLMTTLIHPHAPSAEAFAKAVLLMQSSTGLEWLHYHWQAHGLVVRQDGCVMATANFNRLLN